MATQKSASGYASRSPNTASQASSSSTPSPLSTRSLDRLPWGFLPRRRRSLGSWAASTWRRRRSRLSGIGCGGRPQS
eukprot:11178053-Lingulodinium_polyedra.AAC.1